MRRIALAVLPNVAIALLGAVVVLAMASPDLGGAPGSAWRGPVAGADHWHAGYAIYICGERQPPAPAWDGGVHTHADGIIHIHPVQEFEQGRGSRLVKWFEYGGGELSDDTLRPPGNTRTYTNGDRCPDGRPGRVSVRVLAASAFGNVSLDDRALGEYIPQDGDQIRIEFTTE